MNPKQNYLETIYGGKPEYVPMVGIDAHIGGLFGSLESPWGQDGIDTFGAPWVFTPEGVIPKPGFVMFDDISDWREYVKFPKMEDYDFNALYNAECAAVPQPDRNEKAYVLMNPVGMFDRLTTLMGFENALCALAMDPDECREYFEACADYKIAYYNKLIDIFNPDVLIYSDDVATARGLFMSHDMYVDLMKPAVKRIGDAVNARGVAFGIHCCGLCEEVVPDFVDVGARMWHSAQSVNNLPALLDRFKGKLAIDGGWDSSGAPSYIDASEECVREETRRCLREYKKPGYILTPLLMNEKGNSMFYGDDRMPAVIEEWMNLRNL